MILIFVWFYRWGSESGCGAII